MDEFSSNSTLAHYRIISKLGAGGMGEVYLAQDTKLDRKVALKILPGEVAANKDRMERFVREAKSAAGLNHPNIAHVYEIGKSDTTHFIAMEFIDGETLRDKIYRTRTPLPKLLKYLTQVATGLAKAHAAGIVHRDLKPDNIMITRDDYAKVLDFGLAKLIEGRGDPGTPGRGEEDPTIAFSPRLPVSPSLSTPGIVMGTIGYMSPEQASGRVDEIDHRSDIFSFGCILFEAATGKRAFEGKDALDSLHKIVHAPTPQLKDVNPLAPDDLQRVVRRCLAKERERRYQSIKELAIEIDDLQQQLKGIAESDYSASQASPTIVTTSGASRTDEGFWVAVLPFKYRGSNVDLEALAEGLSEDIVTGLSRFSYLKVVARSPILSSPSESADARSIGKQLGARYVVEGSLRQAGSTLRVSVQLVDTITGTHLWAETYDRVFQPEAIFALQDELVPRIVSTVADQHGVLIHSMAEELRNKRKDQLSPYDAVLSVFGFHERMSPEEHASLRDVLERVVHDFPDQGNCWAMLETIYCDEYMFGFNVRPDPLGRAVAAAQRAVELSPTSNLASQALTQALFFRQERNAFRPVAERTIALNPMDGATVAFMGLLIACSGDWDHGCAVTESAMQLNPHFPGWYRLASIFNAYRQKDYRATLDGILRVNIPGYYWTLLMSAAAHGQLGNTTEAQRSLRELLKSRPEFASTAHEELGKWFAQEFIEHLIEGLQKAGLGAAVNVTSSASSFASSESRANEGFWVAVLPFKFTGSNTEVETLAEGLSEEIVTGLSRFSYLRVISRGSTLRHATTMKHSQSGDLRQIGAELGARYVMEGSIRQAGSTLRVSVQLVDASTGAHLWAETFDRNFQPDQIFAMQDELIPRIVSTCADHFGVLARSISDAIRGKDPSQLSPYEALMRGFGYHYRLNPQEHAEARSILEQAVKDAPNNADCWAMLSWIYSHEYGHGFNTQPGSLDRALAAARRAVDLAPTNHLSYQTLAVALFFRKERANCLSAAERAISLNPLDASNEAIFLITFVDDWERGCSLIRRAMDLNPHVPGWYRLILAVNEYRKGNYREAVAESVKANVPGIWTDIVLSAAYAQLDEQAAASSAADKLAAENSAASVLELLTKWFDAELVEHLVVGLSKAGFEISADKSTTTSAVKVEPSSGVRSLFDARPAIAVLPFDNLSADPEQEFFADGLAEDLITRLSLWRSFPVIARNSSFAYKGDSIDLKKVSSELGVRYVVQGSVRKSVNQVRISAQLIDATTGHHAWAKTYDRELTDVFAVQDEISEAIAASLVGDLQRVEYGRAQRRAPENLEAWLLYQRALPLIYRFTREDSAEARDLLERSIALDSQFSTALARLSELGFWDYLFMWTNSPQQTLDTAVAQARRAVDLDSRDAEARAQLGLVLMTAGFGEEALEAARRGLDLNPSMPFALLVYAYILHMTGHPADKSIELTKRAMRLSPQDPAEFLFYDVLSSAYLNAGRYLEGLATGRRLIALLPGYYWGYLWSAMNAVGLDQIDDARAMIREARRIVPELSITMVRQALGAMAPEVDRHFTDALRQAGLEENEETRGRADDEARESGDAGKVSVSSVTSRDSLSSTLKTIAVLPFKNLSGDPEQEYFADGITEEIINALAQIPGLRVAGRSSAFSFKGQNEDLPTVGAKLSVSTILEGTLRRSGDRLRITAQLIDAGSGYQLWSERYDRVMEDVFAVQDEIANTIATRLQLSLAVSGEVQPAQPPTRHIGAYELYLKGRGLLYQRGLSIPKAIDCFTQAVSLDPQYAQAWAGLADGYTTSGYSGFKLAIEVMPKALVAARRALELDENLAEAHNALACATLLYDRNYELAEREFLRALELNPNYPQARAWYGLFFLDWAAGRLSEGRDEMFRLVRIDPLSAYANVIFCLSCASNARTSEAVEHGRRGVELDPNSYLALWSLAVALEGDAQYEEASVMAERALVLSGRHCWALTTLASIYAGWNKHDDARAVYSEVEARRTREYIQPSMLAISASAVGEMDQALSFAQQAVDEKDPLFVMIARSWPQYKKLRTDPRFFQVVGQLRFPNWRLP